MKPSESDRISRIFYCKSELGVRKNIIGMDGDHI
jgi:hypothetical protein